MWDETSALIQGFLTGSLRTNTSSTNGSGMRLRTIGSASLPPIRIVTTVLGPPSKTFAATVVPGTAASRIGDWMS